MDSDGAPAQQPLLASGADDAVPELPCASVGMPVLCALSDKWAELEQQAAAPEPLGQWMARYISAQPRNILKFLPTGSSPTLEGPDLAPLTRDNLHAHLKATESSSAFRHIAGMRVALCVQNGPYIATALLSIMGQGCCCPVDPNSTEAELIRDCELLRVEAIVVDSGDGPGVAAARKLGLACVHIVVDSSIAGLFRPRLLQSGAGPRKEAPVDDYVLILPTSGTSGQKKAVPYTMETLIVSAACIVESWKLKPNDTCLNMMPLTHVGGITRNLLATLLSGGRLVCWTCFDSVAFWPALEQFGVTWYYATPAMHRSILSEGQHHAARPTRLRMVCNAGGGLPPALYEELHSRFRCSVLAAYGMSECMPISSPPVDFDDSEPTNGPCCGPEVSIINAEGVPLPAGEIGSIAVRGPPTMPGYMNKEHNEGTWINGWFLTGDLGCLSKQGWLRVTGRAKEVIKRGGETISPMEIEEPLRNIEEVVDVAAFAIADSVLGENVALALVLRPGPRIGLPRLRSLLADHLRPALLPQALVFFEMLPKTPTGKVRKAWIAQACKHLTITQDASWRDRIFAAQMPSAVPQSVEEIKVLPAIFDPREADKALQAASEYARTVCSKDGMCVTYVTSDVSIEAARQLLAHLDDHLKPDALVVTKGPLSDQDDDLPRPGPDDFLFRQAYEAPETKWEIGVCKVWSAVIGCDESSISATSDFFEVGGTSLLAGRVASKLQERFHVTLPTHTIFARRRLRELAAFLEENTGSDRQTSTDCLDDLSSASDSESGIIVLGSRFSSTAPHVLLLQLLPIVLLHPFEALLKYIGFQFVLSKDTFIQSYVRLLWDPSDDFLLHCFTFAMAVAVFPLVREFILPVFAVLVKWALLGKVKAGRYPIWGQMYLRWWITRKTMFFCGHGIFDKKQHLKLLGALISDTATLTGNARNLNCGHFVEGDMLTVEDGVVVDGLMAKCVALDGDSLIINPVVIKKNASIAFRTVLAPGTVVPAGASMGPWSSSYEMEDCNDSFRRLNRASFQDPHWLLQYLLGRPLLAMRTFLVNVPWLILVLPRNKSCVPGTVDATYWLDRVHCYVPVESLHWWVIALSVNATIRPLLSIGIAVVLKWLVVGRFVAGPRSHTQWERFRYWFMDQLVPQKLLKNFVTVVGAHYKAVSLFFRAMGAKVGERIFWPGVPLDVREYDLLHVGDDVVFGSRSVVRCTDSEQALEVRIGSGAMVADNCMLQPGTVIGDGAVVGTGSACSGEYGANSVSIGNHGGKAVYLMTGAPQRDSMRPFGRAVYEGKSTYGAMGWKSVLCTNLLSKMMSAPFATIKGWSAFTLLHLLYDHHGSLADAWYQICFLFVAYHVLVLCLHFTCDVLVKWMLIGRRRAGVYPYDENPYCQRWMHYKTKAAMSGEDLTLLGGSWWIVQYYRMLGATIGKNACLYPWGASPSMTEPDLVTLGDSVNVEDAALICHTNVFGRLELSPVQVGDMCTLRDFCRVMGGGTMKKYSNLLEHSLVMSGEVVPSGATWQGWPNRSQTFESL